MTATHEDALDVSTIDPIGHAEAMALLATELDRTLELLRSLSDADWTETTDCPDWDVHHMYLHVLGACESGASLRENLHQMRAASAHRRRCGGPLEAALSAVQVADRPDVGPAQLVERLTTVAPRTVRGRSRIPALVRRVPIQIDGPVVEKWALGYLIDVIYLRDLWMHRVDACRATGAELAIDPEHDGRIVADVVAEWARRHQQPFTLSLSGPAGGRFLSGGAGGGQAAAFSLDGVEFCRTLAGRASGSGLLSTIVPF